MQNESPTSSPPLVGLGMATVDFLTLIPRLPGPDEVFPLQRLDVQGGGPVATALAAANRLGTQCAFVGEVGDDEWGEFILADFGKFEVSSEHVVRRKGGISPHSVILVDGRTGRRSILYSKGGLPGLGEQEVPVQLICGARVLHLDGFQSEAALAAARLARGAGVVVSLDAGAGEPWPSLVELLPLVDLLVVAAQFGHKLTGEEDPSSVLHGLLRWGARHAVITDGDLGAWFLSSDGEAGHVPAFPIDAVDTTGAGDTFHGAYLHAFLQGEPIGECVRFAAAAAALKCTRLGGRAGLPTAAELSAFIAGDEVRD
jgi:sugar/nucleoside kinase (ribokinase family)